MFGEAECVGSKHLSKLINSASMKELKDTSKLIREAFGSPAAHLKTERVEAHFVDVFHVTSFLRQQVAQPRQHRVDMTVEVLISGRTFDECLTLFLRRVLEDAHCSEQSPAMLSAHLAAETAEGSTQLIDIRTMRAKRQQVLTTLKAAVVNDGEVSLRLYMRRSKSLLAFHGDSVAYREPSEGFLRVTRRYKLSYRNERKEVRCFSRHPVESLATGIFLTLPEAQQVLLAYKQQLGPVAADSKTNNSNNSTVASNAIDNSPSINAPASLDPPIEINPAAAATALSEFVRGLSRQVLAD